MEYLAVAKGRVFVYSANDRIYRQYATSGEVKYLACVHGACNGKGKISRGLLHVTVSYVEPDYNVAYPAVLTHTIIPSEPHGPYIIT